VTTTIVFNPGAGSAAGFDAEHLRAALGDGVDIVELGEGRDAATCAREAVAGGARVVVAAGGDGTVSAVASALVGTQAVLGVLPAGTSNSIAGALGIPAGLEAAAAVVRAGHVRVLDTAEAAGRTMVLFCAVGLHARAVADASPEAKQRWGVLAYLAEAVRALKGSEPFELEIETQDERVTCKATNVTVANMAPTKAVLAQGPSSIKPDDGLLDATVVTASSLGEAVASGLHLLRTALAGEPATHDRIGYLSTPRLRLSARPPQPVMIDGEAAGETPVEVVCRPRSLRVLAPPAEEEAPGPREERLEGLPEVAVEPVD
jgi:YegS/Rv2252/BmrU family lipid kinase